MQSRRDPRVDPDEPANADEREDHHAARSDDAHPESVKRRTSPPRSRTAPEFRAEPSPAVETSDLVELPVDAITSYARARASSVRPLPSEPMKSARSQAASYRPQAEPAPAPRAPSNTNVVTNLDPRLEQIEPIIDEANWHTVGKQLARSRRAGGYHRPWASSRPLPTRRFLATQGARKPTILPSVV